MIDIASVHKVDCKKLIDIINHPNDKQNKGLFYGEDEVGGWTAIDNTTGDAFTETFQKSYSALNWLLLYGGEQHV